MDQNIGINSGTLEWFIEGERHRKDGPAIIEKNFKRWFFKDEEFSEKEFKSVVLAEDLKEELPINELNITQKTRKNKI